MPTPLLLPEPVYSEIKELPCARTVRVDEAVETHQVGPAPRRRENLTVFGKIIYSELNGKRHETGCALEVSPNIAAYNVYASDKYSFYS